MPNRLIFVVALALLVHSCGGTSQTTSPSRIAVSSSSASSTPTSIAAADSSEPDANLTPDTAPQVGGGVHCGTERWPVKTLSDGDAAHVTFSPVQATVAQLRSLAAPGSLPQSSRIAPAELTVYSVTANAVEFKLEADKDVHVVIADLDNPSLTMIVEFPDAADCSGAIGSAHRGEMEQARAALTATFGQPSSTHFTSVIGTVTVSGVGFFDVLHGQTGVAPNGIELHPVLSFATGTVLPASANPPVQIPALPQPPPVAGVTFTSVVGARPGGVASATIHTSAGALCSISYVTPAGTLSKAQGLVPITAGGDGVVYWSWNIGSRTHPGTGTVTVSCGAGSASAPIQIG